MPDMQCLPGDDAEYPKKKERKRPGLADGLCWNIGKTLAIKTKMRYQGKQKMYDEKRRTKEPK